MSATLAPTYPAHPTRAQRALERGSRRAGDRPFRTDIQALRAIAVLLVVIYHLRPNRVSGGFIGVDLFFVISGFLITSHLVREATRTGRVRLGAFWAARARRILPASLIAIAVTICLTAWLAPVTLFSDLQKQALASVFYVQNWVLAADSVDYMAAENQATAFQHFWSLSVEEQFYLFWPLIVFGALLLVGNKAGKSGLNLRPLLALSFGAVVLASLAYSVYAVADGQTSAYFVTTTRVWELGAGGLLALVSFRRLPNAWRYTLAYVGLAAIAASAFTLTHETPFPGLAALPVILGTCAVIIAGTPGVADQGNVTLARYDPWNFGSRLRVAQWFGDRSYSLYLWHFPVIALWTMIADRKVDYLDIIAMLVISIVLANFSYRFIEQPVRTMRSLKESTRRSLIAGLLAMLLAAGLTFAYPVMMARAAGAGDWNALAAQARSAPLLGAEAVVGSQVPTFTTDSAAITPNPLEAEQDRNRAFDADDCVGEGHDPSTPECTAGSLGSDRSIALVGDSHARMYSTALADISEENGWSLRTFMRNSCPFSPVPRDMEAKNEIDCTKPNAEVLEKLLVYAPDLVVTTWSFAVSFVDDEANGIPGASGFADYWRKLEAAGIQVLVLRDIPRMDENIPDCVSQNYDSPDVCSRKRTDALPGSALFEQAVAEAPGVDVADFTDVFCTEVVCKSVIGDVLAYYDNHHLTDTFAVSMAPRLRDAIDDVLTTHR